MFVCCIVFPYKAHKVIYLLARNSENISNIANLRYKTSRRIRYLHFAANCMSLSCTVFSYNANKVICLLARNSENISNIANLRYKTPRTLRYLHFAANRNSLRFIVFLYNEPQNTDSEADTYTHTHITVYYNVNAPALLL